MPNLGPGRGSSGCAEPSAQPALSTALEPDTGLGMFDLGQFVPWAGCLHSAISGSPGTSRTPLSIKLLINMSFNIKSYIYVKIIETTFWPPNSSHFSQMFSLP